MHMADALLSPPVAGTMWAASALSIAWSSRKVRQQLDESKVPLMGVLGAFIFAAQMINFTIPGTGSSGHLGGGVLLAVLLGPYAAFLTIASVLVVQALFFADGGLLALGCNIFNLGFIPAFICYPLIYKRIAGPAAGPGRSGAVVVTAVAALQIGALGVVVETYLSGIAALPFDTFALVMLPIHFAIGIVEGFVTAAVISFLAKARPDVLEERPSAMAGGSRAGVLIGFMIAALLTGGVLAWFASEKPDGLEWSVSKVVGVKELESPGGRFHMLLASVQDKTAILPDYSFKKEATSNRNAPAKGSDAATSLSGIVGGAITLAVALLAGFLLKWRGGQKPWINRDAQDIQD